MWPKNWLVNFTLLIDLNLNSCIWLVVTTLDSAGLEASSPSFQLLPSPESLSSFFSSWVRLTSSVTLNQLGMPLKFQLPQNNNNSNSNNNNKSKNKIAFTSIRKIISYYAYLSASVEISESKVYFHAVMPSRDTAYFNCWTGWGHRWPKYGLDMKRLCSL